MNKEMVHTFITSHGPAIGRVLMGVMFLLAGISKVGAQFAGTVGYIGSVGLPMPEILAYLTIALEILGGIALIIGWHMRAAAMLLIGFTILATWFFHNPSDWWSPRDAMQQIMFMKNLAIIGGLFYMAAYGKACDCTLCGCTENKKD